MTHLQVSGPHLERKVSHGEVLSQDVQHANHLGEDQHPMAGVPQPNQQLVQQEQLPATPQELLKNHTGSLKAKLVL